MPTIQHRAYIALGANLGQPEQQIEWAIAELANFGEVLAVSQLYRTAPVGGPSGQPDYLNAALELTTSLKAAELLAGLHAIEAAAGRQRLVHWGPRTLDLDLICYDQQVSSDSALLLPHPRAWQREFVLEPLADIAPQLCHPISGISVSEGLQILRKS